MKGFLEDSFIQITDAIKSAASANIKIANHNSKERYKFSQINEIKPTTVFKESGLSSISATEKIVAIGTSTGGTIALEYILSKCDKAKIPGILNVQHMPEMFTKSFAKRLNDICELEVSEAVDGERLLPGHALIAPGNRHMQVKQSGAQYLAVVSDGALVNRHRPSVDVLFRSVANEVGKNARGIIMTGMGDDGAAGLLELRKMSAFIIAQNEESSVVFRMYKEAIRKGAVDKIVSLENIHREIMDQKF